MSDAHLSQASAAPPVPPRLIQASQGKRDYATAVRATSAHVRTFYILSALAVVSGGMARR